MKASKLSKKELKAKLTFEQKESDSRRGDRTGLPQCLLLQ